MIITMKCSGLSRVARSLAQLKNDALTMAGQA
jgi:hypothetical protein